MRSLRSRLAVLVLVALVPGFALIWHASRAEQQALARTALEDVSRLARHAAEQQGRTLDATRWMLSALAESGRIREHDRDGCEWLLRVLLPRFPQLTSILAADGTGEIFCSAVPMPRPINVGDRLYFRRAMESHAVAVGEFQVGRAHGLPAINVGHPLLLPDGHVAGVVAAAIDARHMSRQLVELGLPDGGVAYVTDRQGQVLAGTDLSPGAIPAPALLAPLLAQPDAPEELDGPDGVRRLYAFEAVAGPDGIPAFRVAVGVPVSKALGPANRILRRTLILYVLLALAAFGAAAVAGHLLLTRRIERVIAAARRLSLGDYAARTGLDRTGGELGVLAGAFDEMAASLDGLTRQHRLVLESAADGILGIDRAHRITFANPVAERLLGVPPGGALGRLLHDYLPGCAERCPACAAMDGGAPPPGDVRVVREDGSSFPAECVAAPAREQGRVVGAVVGLKDVAERRRLEVELRQAQKMEAVGQLAGGIAHDFNNLLTAILAGGELAREALDGHPARADVEEIVAAARRGAALTRRVLAFSRRSAAETRVFDVSEMVLAAEKLLRRLLGEQVEITAEVEPRCFVRADPALLEQAVVNLALNARDAMPRGGRLEIRVRRSPPGAARDPGLPAGPLVELEVADTGVGMDEATRARIFEPFFTTKPDGKGTGLGLSTVYAAVRQAGGLVRVESAPGRGTTFRLHLPAQPEPDLREVGATAPGPSRRGSEAVLLVEDDPAVRLLARRALASAGYDVTEADRPSAALEALQARGRPVDLLVTDVILPEFSGAELAAALGARQPGLRVLYLSGYAAGHLREVEAGKLLPKPFGPEELLARVRAALDAGAPAAASPRRAG